MIGLDYSSDSSSSVIDVFNFNRVPFNRVTRTRPLVNNEESGDDLSVQNIPAPLARRRPSATSVSTNSVSATSMSDTLSTSGTQDTSAITRESI